MKNYDPDFLPFTSCMTFATSGLLSCRALITRACSLAFRFWLILYFPSRRETGIVKPAMPGIIFSRYSSGNW